MPRSTFTTPPGGFSKTAEAALARVAKDRKKFLDMAFYHAAMRGRDEVIRQIDNTFPHPPVDTGKMRDGYEVRKTTRGSVLFNPLPQAAFMEFGTRPHWVRIDVLRAWATRKLRGMWQPGGGKQGPRKRVPKATRDAAIERLARAAQRAIAKRGIRARGFHARAAKAFPKYVREELKKALNQFARSFR